MKFINNEDRKFIENKYHRQDKEFNPFNRFAYHGYEYDSSTGLDDDEMSEGLEKLYSETRDLNHALVKAMGFAYVLDNGRIDVSPHDYFFGFYNTTRPLGKAFIYKWESEVFESMPDVDKIKREYFSSGTAELWLDTEHAVPDWSAILGLGFPGLLSRVKKYRDSNKELNAEQEGFFNSIIIEYEAILRIIDRVIEYANAHPSEKSPLIIESLRRIKNGPPETFYDALMVIYTYHIFSESVDHFQVRSLGNGLDRSLYKFWKHDIESGLYTREELQNFLAYFLLQYSAIGNYWGQPFYLCGTDFDNTTDISELTLDILEVYETLKLYNPKIQIKIDFDTNPKIIYRVLEMIRNGSSSFVFCCIPGMVKSLMSCYGVTEEEARNCDISGCNEMHIRGRETCMISALPNAAKAITYVFFNGIDTVTGKQIGLKTGDVAEMKSFDEFYAAFIAQFTNILDNILYAARKYERFVNITNPSVMFSATIESSLEKGVDAYGYGMKYPTSSMLLCSFATTVDSILAVKELVFETKRTSLAELRDALAANWEGYEDLRYAALHAKKKYGSGNPEADLMASSLCHWFSMHVGGQPNSRGSVYKVGVPSTRHFITQGKKTEATPDGRKMGEECSKNVAPVVGMERGGVTAMMRSALQLSPWTFSEAFVLDMMLHPSAVAGEDGLKAMKALIDTYMKNDGISIQFNIFSEQMLRDAQENPDKYQNLQVRVSGWNVLWNNMSREEQDAYIQRAASIGKDI